MTKLKSSPIQKGIKLTKPSSGLGIDKQSRIKILSALASDSSSGHFPTQEGHFILPLSVHFPYYLWLANLWELAGIFECQTLAMPAGIGWKHFPSTPHMLENVKQD